MSKTEIKNKIEKIKALDWEIVTAWEELSIMSIDIFSYDKMPQFLKDEVDELNRKVNEDWYTPRWNWISDDLQQWIRTLINNMYVLWIVTPKAIQSKLKEVTKVHIKDIRTINSIIEQFKSEYVARVRYESTDDVISSLQQWEDFAMQKKMMWLNSLENDYAKATDINSKAQIMYAMSNLMQSISNAKEKNAELKQAFWVLKKSLNDSKFDVVIWEKINDIKKTNPDLLQKIQDEALKELWIDKQVDNN